jgi:hypothetical protein
MDGIAATRMVYIFGWFWLPSLVLFLSLLLSAISSLFLHGEPVTMQAKDLFLLLLCPSDFVDLWDGWNFFWKNNEWFCQISWCWVWHKICTLKYYKQKLSGTISPCICLGSSVWLQLGRSEVLLETPGHSGKRVQCVWLRW